MPGVVLRRRLQAKTGARLTELSVCDLALRNLVRPTELNELAEVGFSDQFTRCKLFQVCVVAFCFSVARCHFESWVNPMKAPGADGCVFLVQRLAFFEAFRGGVT